MQKYNAWYEHITPILHWLQSPLISSWPVAMLIYQLLLSDYNSAHYQLKPSLSPAVIILAEMMIAASETVCHVTSPQLQCSMFSAITLKLTFSRSFPSSFQFQQFCTSCIVV